MENPSAEYKRPLLIIPTNNHNYQNNSDKYLPNEILSCSINSEDHEIVEEKKEVAAKEVLLYMDDGVEDLENNLTRDITVVRPRTVETILIAK